MGLGGTNYNTNAADVGVDDAGRVDGCGGKCFGSVSCSICLEVVADNGDRSWAKLQCGHQFHLDCIGSAFNIKGAMQCPNCRKIEKGQWLYANGSRSSPEFNMDDWPHDEDLYDLSYSDVSFGVHWCPFDSFAGHPSSFEHRITGCDIFREEEFSPTTYHVGQHAVSSSSSSSSSHPCPYFTYVGPIHNPSSSNSSESVSDNLTFNNHWTGHSSAPSNFSHGFPPMDLNYQWEHDQPSAPPVTTQRQARNFSLPQSGSFVHHPFLAGQSSSVRGPSPVIPPYPGSNARARNRDQALQAYYHHQQPANSSAMRSANRRSHRSTGQIGPGATSSSDTRPGAHHYTPPETNGRSFQETENNRFHSWESDHFPSFSLNQLDRDFGWGNSYEGAGGSDHGGVRPINFRQRHESERNWW